MQSPVGVEAGAAYFDSPKSLHGSRDPTERNYTPLVQVPRLRAFVDTSPDPITDPARNHVRARRRRRDVDGWGSRRRRLASWSTRRVRAVGAPERLEARLWADVPTIRVCCRHAAAAPRRLRRGAANAGRAARGAARAAQRGRLLPAAPRGADPHSPSARRRGAAAAARSGLAQAARAASAENDGLLPAVAPRPRVLHPGGDQGSRCLRDAASVFLWPFRQNCDRGRGVTGTWLHGAGPTSSIAAETYPRRGRGGVESPAQRRIRPRASDRHGRSGSEPRRLRNIHVVAAASPRPVCAISASFPERPVDISPNFDGRVPAQVLAAARVRARHVEYREPPCL